MRKYKRKPAYGKQLVPRKTGIRKKRRKAKRKRKTKA